MLLAKEVLDEKKRIEVRRSERKETKYFVSDFLKERSVLKAFFLSLVLYLCLTYTVLLLILLFLFEKKTNIMFID